MTTTIGAMLRAARKAAGLTARELADLVSTAQPNITAAETRDRVHLALIDAMALDRDAAYHAAGRVPAELVDGLAGNLPLMRHVRSELNL